MIESKHAAEYKCRARNTVGWSEPASSILEVVYIPSAKVVEEVVNVRLGDENVTLKCVAEHIEPTWKVNYTWTKEKAVLGDSSVYVIPLIRRSSAGVYKCIVTNSFGSSVPALVKLNTLDSYVDIEGFYRSGDEEQKIYVKCSITNQAKFRAVTSLKIIQRSTHTNILVTINQAGNIWTNRQNVYVAGNISNPEIAFLELLITKNNIICPGDFTEYFCRCVGVDKSSSPIIDESKILPIEFDESPKYMSDIQMNIKSQRIINQTLDFGTTIELVCEGDITMWDSKLQNIRWCLKIGGYGTFTPWVAHIKTINITSKSCYKMQRSIITYTVEIVNGTTEFICESGYTTMCGTGSAIAHMTVLSAKSTEPTKPQFHERAAPFPFFYISLSMLTSSLVVVIGIMIVCVIKWKISRASLKGNIRSESYKQKRAQTNTTQFGSGDDYLQPISTRRENFHEYEMIVGYTDATSDNKKKTSRCQIL
ncbi:uncharacterized protein LOC134262629 [Saccostrea cucullata]|uniref:uncharacterized protein LOC134262629 n=1 Tax=Saccostrea cuccullata TaxID=36930 RepID=UPI002ED6B7CE